jgi:hypothetical protein
MQRRNTLAISKKTMIFVVPAISGIPLLWIAKATDENEA